MSIYSPSLTEFGIYGCILFIGIIIGRILTSIQVEVMRSIASTKKNSDPDLELYMQHIKLDQRLPMKKF